ncbi:hypothetical protein Pmani_006714 [Petrolisthes manimaculis]|uniref:Uncharacterized protein n=1 Tax=Petrolisthes manimaculis TaxID=1843537 RepID=A0AAE1UFG9_9EUCA|nr:hypothetical protein Pmani_006714 [Petrolisthes manimaculis]
MTCYFSKAVRGDKEKPYTFTQDMRKKEHPAWLLIIMQSQLMSDPSTTTGSTALHGLNSWCFYRRVEADRTNSAM